MVTTNKTYYQYQYILVSRLGLINIFGTDLKPYVCSTLFMFDTKVHSSFLPLFWCTREWFLYNVNPKLLPSGNPIMKSNVKFLFDQTILPHH